MTGHPRRVSHDEIMEAGTRLADGLVAVYQLRGPASTIRQLVLALGRERERADALERIISDPEAIPHRISRLTDAAERLVEEARALREAIPRPDAPHEDEPAPNAMCRCGHSSEFHVHRGLGHCGECSACQAFFEAYPEPAKGRTVNPERAPMVETRYGTLPVGTRIRMGATDATYVLARNRVWTLVGSPGDGYQRWCADPIGEIIPWVACAEGWPLYCGDRVSFVVEYGGARAGERVTGTLMRRSDSCGLAVLRDDGETGGDDETGAWLLNTHGRSSLRKIHDEPAS